MSECWLEGFSSCFWNGRRRHDRRRRRVDATRLDAPRPRQRVTFDSRGGFSSGSSPKISKARARRSSLSLSLSLSLGEDRRLSPGKSAAWKIRAPRTRRLETTECAESTQHLPSRKSRVHHSFSRKLSSPALDIFTSHTRGEKVSCSAEGRTKVHVLVEIMRAGRRAARRSSGASCPWSRPVPVPWRFRWVLGSAVETREQGRRVFERTRAVRASW